MSQPEIPFGLQLADVIISFIAFTLGVIAMQPFVQLIWGRPRISIDFNELYIDANKVLQCELSNPPVRKRILRMLGVRRTTAEDVVADFSVYRHATDEVLVPLVVPKIVTQLRDSQQAGQRINMPASFIPARVGLFATNPETGLVDLFGDGDSHTFPTGRYYVKFRVHTNSDVYEKQRGFTVHSDNTYGLGLSREFLILNMLRFDKLPDSITEQIRIVPIVESPL